MYISKGSLYICSLEENNAVEVRNIITSIFKMPAKKKAAKKTAKRAVKKVAKKAAKKTAKRKTAAKRK